MGSGFLGKSSAFSSLVLVKHSLSELYPSFIFTSYFEFGFP